MPVRRKNRTPDERSPGEERRSYGLATPPYSVEQIRGPDRRNWGQADQGGRGFWGNQGNWGNEGYFQGFEESDETWGPHGSRSVERIETWAKPGGYVGLGPKGYKRSDERMWEEINERMTDHPDLDARDIDVTVSQGEVTLAGSVSRRGAKRLAEDIADTVSGVKDVHNQLKIQESAA
ncbi:MAG: BON domain-containing protein [Bryobacteraceae bacterium]